MVMSAASRKTIPCTVTFLTGAALVPLIEINVSSCTATSFTSLGGGDEGDEEDNVVEFGIK